MPSPPVYPFFVPPADALLYTLSAFWGIRSTWILFSAEQGRRQDLAYRPPIKGQDFEVNVVIPLMNADDDFALQDCLTCMTAQDYQNARLIILAHPQAHWIRDSLELPDSCQWINVPEGVAFSQESLLRWGFKRILATHPPDLFVLLDVSDLIKPDFLSHTVSVAYQHDVYQGYMAHRDFGEGVLSRSLGLLTRLRSRIESVGRFHGGLGLLFRHSGLAFKPNVLEHVALEHHPGLGYAPWSITLNQASAKSPSLKVHWVPSMIIYQRHYPDVFSHVAQELDATFTVVVGVFNRFIRLARPRELEQRLAMLPSNLMLNTLALASVAALVQQGIWPEKIGTPFAWSFLAAGQLLLWAMTLKVARIKPTEWLNSTLIVLSATLLEILAFPVALTGWIAQKLRPLPRTASLQAPEATPFSPQPALQRAEPRRPSGRLPVTSRNSLPIQQTLDTHTPFILTLGSQEIVADIEVDIQPCSTGLLYGLTLTYKHQRFQTQHTPKLEEAFIELTRTLSHYQIQPKTCGNCAYWFVHNTPPPAGKGLPLQGTCLKDKVGQPLNEQDVALNVLSLPCDAHTPRLQHDAIVHAWKESIDTVGETL
jgi:hypothetical protein